MVETSLAAVFLIGLFGGVHCAGMCGGIVAALGLSAARARQARPASTGLAGIAVVAQPAARAVLGSTSGPVLVHVLGFNVARILTYTALGAAAGALGSLGLVLDRLLPVQQAAFLLANLMLLAMGCYVLGWRWWVQAVESLGAPVWRRIQPHAAKALGRGDARGLWLAGALWGLVPCGMVYTVLIAALTSGRAVDGALLMLAFGLGTLPNLTLMGVSAGWLARLRSHRLLRRIVGVALIAFAIVGLLRLEAVYELPLIGELCFRPRS